MQTFVAPSEIVIDELSGRFGYKVENIVYSDFCKKFSFMKYQLYKDGNNLLEYEDFLVTNNKNITSSNVKSFIAWNREDKFHRLPDILVHTGTHKEFYEIKANSKSGLKKGADKVGKLMAVYPSYNLPYQPGTSFHPTLDHQLAYYGSAITVDLCVQSAAPGLIVYSLRLRWDESVNQYFGDKLAENLTDVLRLVIYQNLHSQNSPVVIPIDLKNHMTLS